MSSSITRRDALKDIAAAGAGLALATQTIRGQSPIVIAGQPVEIVIARVSAATLRISVLPLKLGASSPPPKDQALVQAASGQPFRRLPNAFRPLRTNEYTIQFEEDPPTLRILGPRDRLIQQFTFDRTSPTLSFALGKGPLLGFGEGGPQFDRKGAVYTNRNGQGGYQLRTHGGRVPIQWFASTDAGGCMCISRLARSISPAAKAN